MAVDDEGFVYPQKNDSCTDCKICEKICPSNNIQGNNFKKLGFLSYNLDEDDLKNSSSGGMYPALAKYALGNNGYVVGVRWDNNLNAMYDIAETYEEAYAFRFSKYVEPEHNDIFKKTKTALETGRIVLFTGSPCVITGLKAYLGKEFENLFTVDILCHGGASPLVLRKYADAMSLEKGVQLVRMRFRSPIAPTDYATDHEYENGETETILGKDCLYTKAYLKDLFLKKSCYLCPLCMNHQADITIGDFWGWKNVFANPDSKKLSGMIINSNKGLLMFENIKNGLFTKPVATWDIMSHNRFYPVAISPGRAEVIKRIVSGENALEVFREALSNN
jgi:coenzyme F420-reducing hydrogenase beta subunit